MKRTLLLLSLLCVLYFSISVEAYPPPATVARARLTTHYIEQTTLTDFAGCSATAIGPHALLTATHCELPTDQIFVDGDEAKVLWTVRDGKDHSILFLDGVRFERTARVTKPSSFGDTVFMFGNPGALHDIFRTGNYAGSKAPGFFDPPAVMLLYDIKVFHGDSGAALFDAESGDIAAVVTGDVGNKEFTLEFSYPLSFTPAQLDEARRF